MALNFNTDPYYDDFDPNKNYHRILFRPGRAVQARELTQLQTILQNQISNFADSIFAKNTPVSGGKVTLNLRCYYLKLFTEYQGATITAGDFLNKVISDSTGTVVAKVIATAESTSDGGDPPTLIISYLSGTQFTDNTVIYPIDGTNTLATTIGTTGGTTCTGPASTASISQGIFYVVNGYNYSNEQNPDGTYSRYSIGNFVTVQPSTTILSKYSSLPTARVGLIITETYADYISDPNLLDPTLGSTNYQAPGADRYIIDLTLTSFPFTLVNDQNFIELVRIENGVVTKQVDDTVYSKIDDYFAKRTYDTNGDYVVNNFKLTPVANTVNSNTFDINIGKGVAYVRGYRIENQSPITVTTNKAREYNSLNNNTLYINYGNFLYVKNVAASTSGMFDITDMSQVNLHCVPLSNVVTANANTYNSTLVATARIRDLKYERYANTIIDTSSYVYKMHLFDTATTVLSGNVKTAASDGTTIDFFDITGKFSSKSGAYVGATITIDSGTDVAKITEYNGSTKTATVSPALSTIPTSVSTFSIRFRIKDAETIVRTNTNYYIISSASIDNSSKVGSIASGDVILQDTSRPELIFPLGNRFVKTIADASYESQKYFRNKSFSSISGTTKLSITLGSSALNFLGRTVSSGNLSDSEINSLFTVIVRNKGSNSGLTDGQILNFAGDADRNVAISNDRLTATFSATDLVTPLTVDIIAKISVPAADNSSVVLRSKNLIKAANSQVYINGTTVAVYTKVNLTYGQVYIQKSGIVEAGKKQSLFVSDVKKIVKIIDTLNAATTPTNAMLSDSAYDVTSFYDFSNGQTDNYYDHASITLKTGAPKSKGNLLVLFDYYSPTGGDGYFDVNSYLSPISSSPEKYEQLPSYVAKNGASYPLRDCLDFRPTRKNANSTFSFAFTTDQSSTDSGALIPTDLSIFTNDYSYYLPRKDILVLTKDKSFQIINGISSNNPTFPSEPDGSLILSQITLDAYTSYITGENPIGTTPSVSLRAVQHKRFTMQDISELQNRLNNVEYYTALNVLEQQAQTTQIPDVNGLNRFKNGILVDDFSSFATADSANPDFSCSINKRTRQLSAQQTVWNFPLQSSTALSSFGQPASGSSQLAIYNLGKTYYFSLPSTPVNVTSQQFATTTVNVNPFAISVVEGTVDLNPPMDNWVDNTKAPDILIVDPNLQVYQQTDKINQLSAGDWKAVPGTTTSATSSVVNSFNVEGHGINWSPFGYYGYTQTDTTTVSTVYATLAQNNVMGAYNKIGNTYNINNNFITDISILPYIRSQQIMIRANGLKINSPITCTFDGVNVNDYMSAPDSIELKDCTGTFNQNDIIGYINSNKFLPIATVASVYYYPGTSNVRLYIAGNYHTSYQFETAIEKITNAFYDSTGAYVSSTASGSIIDSKIISTHKNGYVAAVGGTFIDVLGSTIKYYRVAVNHGPFSDTFGIWGRPNGYGVTLPAGKFNFTVPDTGTYYLRVGSDDDKNGYVKIDGTTYWNIHTLNGSGGVYSPAGIYLTAGTHTFEIYCNSTDDDGDAYIGAAISSGPWDLYSQTSTVGQVIFSTASLKGATTPLNAGTQIEMPGGGLYYVGATQVSLNGMAKPVDNFYNGCKIKFSSTYVELDVFTSKVTSRTETYTANITSFTASSCLVTLDAPVNISVGGNLNLGGIDLTSSYTIDGTETSYKLAAQKNKLDTLSTNENGNFTGIFNIPSNKFKNGERVFRIDNRTVATDPTTATTFAESTFTASGLSTKSQSLEFGASVAGAKNTFTQTKYLSNQVVGTSSTTVTTYSPWDPLAQAFLIDKSNYPDGLFLDSISLFFQSKPATSDPITLSIVGTLNGYPNGETLDHSIVTLPPSKVKTISSTNNLHYLNPDASTVFQFPAPVYIQAGVLYAFLLKSSSTDYNLYAAARDGTIIASTSKTNYTDVNPTGTQKLGNAPYVAALFESQNGITWTADQAKSLMMVINRCKFTKGTRDLDFVVPRNLPQRKNASSTINSNLNPDLVINTQGAYPGKNVSSCAFNVTTTDFIPNGTNITYSYNATLNSTGEKVGFVPITPGKFGCPTADDIYLSDGLGERILLKNSNNSFVLSATINSQNDILSPIICDDGLSLYNIEWKINDLGISNNQIVIVDDGAGYDSNARVTISAPDLSGGTQAYANVKLFGDNVQSIFITTAGSGYLNSPIVTVTGPNTQQAIISTISEYSPRGGNADCKYITKKVVLAPGNDSQDLRVYYTAYKPTGTNIYVFYKLLSSGDTSNFDDNSWQLMTDVGGNRTLVSKNRTDIYEFQAAPGINGTANNTISYVNPNGQTYNSFIQFAIKIVMTAKDRTTIPTITSLRAIALPSGTGL